MESIAFDLLICMLAFWFGYSANRGGTCLVVAAHELQKRRPPRMFVGFVAASAAAGLVAIPLAWSGTLNATLAPSTNVNAFLLIGAIAFGFGALINDTCLLGSLARLGDGEMRLLALPVGLAVGDLDCRSWSARLSRHVDKSYREPKHLWGRYGSRPCGCTSAGGDVRIDEGRIAKKTGLGVWRLNDWPRYHWWTSLRPVTGMDVR